jgi:hypothetical protein
MGCGFITNGNVWKLAGKYGKSGEMVDMMCRKWKYCGRYGNNT